MKLIFISDYISIHQKALCDAFHLLLKDDFLFVATTKIRQARVDMGWKDYTDEVSYAVHHDRYTIDELRQIIAKAEVVILGSSHAKGISSILRNRLVFNYAERPLKKGIRELCNMRRLYAIVKTLLQQRNNLHLLAAGFFCAKDYAMMGCYRQRAWKWGYFIEPICQHYRKRENDVPRILWLGRMLDWKHCELAIQAAHALCDHHLKAHFTVIGTGPEYGRVCQLVKEYHLEEQIEFIDSMNNMQIREMLKDVDILLCTSDRYEGWGVVVNEAMSAGCCVIASDEVGAASYLIKPGDNGLLFRSGDSQSLSAALEQVVANPQLAELYGRRAVETLNGAWHPRSAAERFVTLCQNILAGQSVTLQPDGPCSPAL